MAAFASTEEAETILGDFLEQIVNDPEIKPKFVHAATSFRVTYTEPTCVISLDSRQDPPVVRRGQAALNEPVEVELTMSADDGHQFWLGELNVPVALAKRRVKVTGPLTRLLKLLPALQPAFARYPVYLASAREHDATA